MNTLSSQLFALLALGLGDSSWQEFVDRYAEKYDNISIDGYDFAPTQIGYTFQQLIASTGATTLPAYVDPDSPAYETALNSVRGISDNIPTQKKFYRLNRTTVQERLQLFQRFGNAALTSEMRNVFTGLLDESTDGLIKGFYNSLSNQRDMINSTGQFTIDTENNPRGLNGITIEFGIDTSHFDTLTGDNRWWTASEHTTANEGANADPIKYIKDRVKYIRRTKHYYGPMHVEISQDLYDDIVTHSAVLKRIGHAMYPNVTNNDTVIANAQNYDEDALHAYMNKLCKIEIKPRDSYAYVAAIGLNEAGEKDIVSRQIDNFKVTNISFVPDGNMGSIMGVEPLTLGYDEDKVARFNDGRLVLTQRANPETHSIYIESEAAQICVPNKPQGMFISTVTA